MSLKITDTSIGYDKTATLIGALVIAGMNSLTGIPGSDIATHKLSID